MGVKPKCISANRTGVLQLFFLMLQHDAAVKVVQWLPQHNIVMSGSWDKTLRYWDGRQPNPVLSVPLPDKLYSAAEEQGIAVVATADRSVLIFDLRNPGAVSYSSVFNCCFSQ